MQIHPSLRLHADRVFVLAVRASPVSSAWLNHSLVRSARLPITLLRAVLQSDHSQTTPKGQAMSLVSQAFSGNPLDRSLTEHKQPHFLAKVLQEANAEFLLIAEGRSLCVSLPSNGDGSSQGGSVKWFRPDELSDLGLVNHSGVLSVGGGGSFQLVHPVLLGKLPHKGVWRLALDVSPSRSTQEAAKSQGLTFQDLRSLLPIIPAEDLSIAGQAVALLQWHKANEYCGRCGARTTPVEMGGRRQCTSDKSHRAYPRTDPVMITLVESTDGKRALLGRPKSLSRRGVLTCLSGFIEQGESIEECVRREVMEEAGVPVGEVAVLGSQPWPIGRGGTCEVMIGCMAKATDDVLHVNEEEMDAVRWVTKEEAQKAIQHSSVTDVASTGQGAAFSEGHLDFFIPPKWAIAHHLIQAWATRGDSWFSKL